MTYFPKILITTQDMIIEKGLLGYSTEFYAEDYL